MSQTTKWILAASMSAIAMIVSPGCTDLVVEPELGGRTDALWTPCAQQGGVCTFSGTRTVRYGRDGRYSIGEFTGSVLCSRTSFPAARLYRNRNTCEVDMSVPTVDAGTPTMADASAHTGGAPYINVAAIPTGDPGTSSILLQPTSEQPSPGDGTGAFRTACQFSHMNFDDPIVYPGQPGRAHLHTYFGNTDTDSTTTASSLRNSGNSTCRGGIINRSGYWVPALIDSRGTPLRPLIGHIYYKTGYHGVAPRDVRPFPSGLRMIAGNGGATGPQPQSDGMSWSCHTRYVGNFSNLVDIDGLCHPGETLSMEINFPQCWDGVNLDSTNHKSHMAQANGGCPTSHPVPIPAITFQVHYTIPPEGTRSLRLASDHYDSSLPGGYSIHGDWFDGWDPAIVQTFVTRCDNPALDCHSHLLGDGRAMGY